MKVTKVEISPNHELLKAKFDITIEFESPSTYNSAKLNITYYVDSAFNNIPVSVCQDVEVGTINVGTNKISTSASGIDVDSIPQEIQMNMGLLEIIVTSVDSPTDLITLRCVTQVAKKASGGPLYRVFYSPL